MTAKATSVKYPVTENPNRKLVARLVGRREAHAIGVRDAANKHHGHQIPGSMKKVY